MKSPAALIILDGWGYSPDEFANSIAEANTPNFDKLNEEFPSTLVATSGLSVGLPEGQMGNSEVGHLNIGAGRVVYQELTRITKSIKDGDFFDNSELMKAINNAKENGKALHFLGLLSDGGVHSHMNHIKGLLDLAKKNGLTKVYLHAFLDGRDTPPRSAKIYMEEIKAYMDAVGVGEVATVSGRYYAMDRDQRWERIQLAYDALVHGKGKEAESAIEAIENAYDRDENDEFVLPTVVNGANGQIGEKDSIIFFNFRPDRARQMTRVFADAEFNGFERQYFENTYVCMTRYDDSIKNVNIAFKPQTIKNTIGEYLSDKGLNQLRIAETEKYAHVTFFFNGGVEAPCKNEERALIASPKVATYDMKPEMSVFEVTDELIKRIDEDKYDFIVLNYANPDMLGHTGVEAAAVKAVEAVDTCLARVVDKLASKGAKIIITADHGNAEQMIDKKSGNPMTAHTTNDVPCIVIGAGDVELRKDGSLSDLAPTLLKMMDIPQPSEMSGKSLY